MPEPPRLFDPESRDAIRRSQASVWIPLLAIVTLICGGLAGVMHHEIPFIDYMAGNCDANAAAVDCPTRFATSVGVAIAATLVFGALSVLLYRKRPIRPTVQCERCSGVGWVMDLETFNGRCPHCGYDLFIYRSSVVEYDAALGALPRRLVEGHMRGIDLIRRYHSTRRSSMNRYY